MKILNCYIENFGKLHDFSIDFVEKTNIICEGNGWGKSTLAAFIRAMFYGLEGERKRSIEENEPKRYKPWQGGIFGGRLTFETNGKEYTITRNFANANDFELRDAKTNMISFDYSQNIGEELFGVNRESFMRTVFIAQNDCETSSTDDINAKIGNLTDNTNDINSFEAANARLVKLLNELTPGRITGSIAQRRDKIASLERMINDGSDIEGSIEKYQEKLNDELTTYEEIKLEIDDVAKLQKKVSELQTVLAKKQEWMKIQMSYKEKEEALMGAKKMFSGEIPNKFEVDENLSLCSRIEDVSRNVLAFTMTEEEKCKLSQLQDVFDEDVPQEKTLDEMVEKAQKLARFNNQLISEDMTQEEKNNLKQLSVFFNDDGENVSAMVAKWNNRNAKKASLPSNQAALTALKATMSATINEKKTSLMSVIGIVLTIIGAIMTTANVVVGIIMLVIGVLLWILGKNSKRNVESQSHETSPEIENLQRTIGEDEEYIKKTDYELKSYLEAHGKVFDEAMVSYVLSELTADYIKYTQLKKKSEKFKDNEIKSEMEKLKASIVDFMLKYKINADESAYMERLFDLKNKASVYETLEMKKDSYHKAVSEYTAVSERIDKFFEKYGYKATKEYRAVLLRIRDDVLNYENKNEIYQECKENMAEFKNSVDMSLLADECETEEYPSLEELSEKIVELTSELEVSHKAIVDYRKQIEELREKYDEWESIKINLEEEKRIQEEEQEKYNRLNLTKKYLTMAKENMTLRYSEPILESFSKYYQCIEGGSAENFHIDANTVITVDELGKQRDTNTLSLGYRDLIGVCLRVALIDAMYTEEIPVIIMDDPFTNLDDDKQMAAKNFLKLVAEKYQIIYFTCSNSRI